MVFFFKNKQANKQNAFLFILKKELSRKLKQSPDTFEDLKSVLSTISEIRAMSLNVEMRFNEIKERYRTLSMYKVEVMDVHS